MSDNQTLFEQCWKDPEDFAKEERDAVRGTMQLKAKNAYQNLQTEILSLNKQRRKEISRLGDYSIQTLINIRAELKNVELAMLDLEQEYQEIFGESIK